MRNNHQYLGITENIDGKNLLKNFETNTISNQNPLEIVEDSKESRNQDEATINMKSSNQNYG